MWVRVRVGYPIHAPPSSCLHPSDDNARACVRACVGSEAEMDGQGSRGLCARLRAWAQER